jgi:hypothetical protein
MRAKVVAVLLVAGHISGSYMMVLYDRIMNYDLPGLSLSWIIFAPIWILASIASTAWTNVSVLWIPFFVAYGVPHVVLISIYALRCHLFAKKAGGFPSSHGTVRAVSRATALETEQRRPQINFTQLRPFLRLEKFTRPCFAAP